MIYCFFRGYCLTSIYRRSHAFDQTRLNVNSTPLQRTKVLEHSNRLRRKIDAWRNIQAVYIPGVTVLLSRLQDSAPAGSAAELPEDAMLYLPSGLNGQVPCDSTLKRYEYRFRLAQARDALDDIRNHLRVRSYMWKKKRRDIRGVAAGTRAQAALSRQQDKIDVSARRYRVARKALMSLADQLGEDKWDHELRPLKPEDIKGLHDDGSGAPGTGKLKNKGKQRAELGEGTKRLSWIWTDLTAATQAGQDPGLNDGEWLLWMQRTR
jgi:hypothetical protein